MTAWSPLDNFTGFNVPRCYRSIYLLQYCWNSSSLELNCLFWINRLPPNFRMVLSYDPVFSGWDFCSSWICFNLKNGNKSNSMQSRHVRDETTSFRTVNTSDFDTMKSLYKDLCNSYFWIIISKKTFNKQSKQVLKEFVFCYYFFFFFSKDSLNLELYKTKLLSYFF